MRENHIGIANVRRLAWWSVVVLLLMVPGCCKPFDASTKQENNSARAWVTESWKGPYDWKRISRWKTVAVLSVSQAEALLQSTAVVRITEAQAQEFVGESNLREERETPYLLRAVGDANETFALEPSVRPDGTVWVGGGANSKCPVSMQRRPFVVWLNRMPEKVYVTFYVNRD